MKPSTEEIPGMTSINQVQRLLGEQSNKNPAERFNEAGFIKALNLRVDDIDPANISLLNEVLDTLKYKNGNSQQADGQIAEFMHPNPLKIKEALDKEKEVIRKLNYSGVVPMDKSGQYPSEPTRLIQLQHQHGIKNNKKQPPQAENIYYQALMKAKDDSKG